VQSYSDESNGSFLVCLPVNADYALNVNKTGFLFHSEHFQFAQPMDEKMPQEKNIQLHPIQIGEIVVMRNIFFDFDSDKLKMESIVELKKLMQLLKDNPLMHIEIRGHTDNVGSAQYNKALSERRAMSVFNYLVENGIRKERLKYKGFGDTMPIAPNDTDEGRALNRRTEFMVTKI
jgi:outer membrane protein OmpA-like peptidoglycan-associated protein